MIPGKEHLVYFEKLAQQHRKINNKFCSYLSNSELLIAREHLKGLTDIYRSSIKYIGKKSYSVRWTSLTRLFIPFEEEDGYYHGVLVAITYTFTPPDKHRMEVFINREIHPNTMQVYKNKK